MTSPSVQARGVYAIFPTRNPADRWALITDFTQNREVLDDAEHKRLGQYEWFKNAKLFREDWPVTDDIWRHWKIGRND